MTGLTRSSISHRRGRIRITRPWPRTGCSGAVAGHGHPGSCRPAYRRRVAPEDRNDFLGFRVAAVQE